MSIAISEYSHIEISNFLQKYIPDIHYYNKSFIERRFHAICEKLHIPSLEAFLERIESNVTFIDQFMYYFTVPVTEMFRDSSTWKAIFTSVLPELQSKEKITIWFPNCSTGEELYSLCILLQEFGITDRCIIYASHRSIYGIESIKKGIYSTKNEKLYTLNYTKLNLKDNLETYYSKSYNNLYMNASLLKNVKFIYSTSIFKQIPDKIDLVMFRNILLYFEKEMHNIIMSHIFNNMQKDGFLLLGLQDNTMIYNLDVFCKNVNSEERIYKKR